MRNALRQFWNAYVVEILIGVAGLVLVNAIFLPKAFRESTTVNREAAAQLGSFVGGYIGPIFTLIGVVLLVRTLKSQSQSAKEQSFETKYFELIKMHRDNVAELELQDARGRKIFVLLIRELRCALEIIQKIVKEMGLNLENHAMVHIAHYCLFFGVGPNSSRMLRMSLSEFDQHLIESIEKELNNPDTKKNIQVKRDFNYLPFEGHQSRLGHYYRHLYQMVRYVDQQKLDIDKYQYVKTIRAQLSTHEQALLLINSLTPIGQSWWRKGFIEKYRLVQNIPRDFFDSPTELDLSTLFKPEYFEWEELVKRGTREKATTISPQCDTV